MSEEMSAEQLLGQAKTIRESLTKHMDENDTQTEEFLAGDRTIQWVTSYIDTWQHSRGGISRYHWKVVRALEDARDKYGEGMRKHMSKGLQGRESSWHYEERAEVYKTKNLGLYQKLRILEKLDVELKAVLRHFDAKIRWLEDMRRQMRRDDDDFRFSSVRDHIGS